jgi:hypothetical protein
MLIFDFLNSGLVDDLVKKVKNSNTGAPPHGVIRLIEIYEPERSNQ